VRRRAPGCSCEFFISFRGKGRKKKVGFVVVGVSDRFFSLSCSLLPSLFLFPLSLSHRQSRAQAQEQVRDGFPRGFEVHRVVNKMGKYCFSLEGFFDAFPSASGEQKVRRKEKKKIKAHNSLFFNSPEK